MQCYFEARSRAGYLFTANQIGAIESLTAILTAAPPDKDEKGRNYILMKARNIQECCSMMNQDELTDLGFTLAQIVRGIVRGVSAVRTNASLMQCGISLPALRQPDQVRMITS